MKDELWSYYEVSEYLPQKLSRATFYRWMNEGVRGKVLEGVRVGVKRFTTLGALKEFMGYETES